jgi:hypothetical protein
MNHDESQYELHERIAILLENNPGMHPVHAINKAKKELLLRKQQDLQKQKVKR